jgi:hypothetical protein
VYDTVLEETGDSGAFEQRIGRVRLVEGIALVSSSVAGGWVAGITATRVTYFLTIPFAVLSIIAYLRFREPLLHKEGPAKSLRDHLAVTFRTLTRQRMLLPIIALAVLSSLILQVMFEFGPLWMVALAVPPVLYGPYWAGLVSTLGIGGLLAGRLRLDRPAPVAAAVGVMIAAALVLPTPAGVAVVIIAQITLALVMVLASIHVTRLLHDAVPSTVRTGVASGVSALSWIAFLPFALVFGVVSRDHGVRPASWMIIVVTVLAGILLAAVARLFGPSEPAPSGIDRPQERNNLATALRD